MFGSTPSASAYSNTPSPGPAGAELKHKHLLICAGHISVTHLGTHLGITRGWDRDSRGGV